MTAAMARLFASGHAVDIVLAVMLAEAGWLVARRGWPLGAALAALLPGALILLALRGALTGQDWRWIALPLTLSLPVHLVDIVRRRPVGAGAARSGSVSQRTNMKNISLSS